MKQSDRIIVCHLGNPLLANTNVSLLIDDDVRTLNFPLLISDINANSYSCQ
jgi:hypothetical protein